MTRFICWSRIGVFDRIVAALAGATAPHDLPDAAVLIAAKGDDSDWFREALTVLATEPCIPGRTNRKTPIPDNADRHKLRSNRIERMCGRTKHWRRVATRHDRCAHAFLSGIRIAATVIFWFSVLSLFPDSGHCKVSANDRPRANATPPAHRRFLFSRKGDRSGGESGALGPGSAPKRHASTPMTAAGALDDPAAPTAPTAPTAAPRVAVVIPAWNAATTIGRAVRSALAQTAPCHVVVIDDASSDGTADAARATGEAAGEAAGAADAKGRLTVLTARRNAGPAAARNLGIAEAARRGADWIALLDADDFMDAGRIAGLLAHAEPARSGSEGAPRDAPAWDMVADDLLRVVEGAVDGPKRRLLAAADFEPFALDFESFVLGNLHGARGDRGELGFLKPLMRREFLDAAGLRYDEAIRLGEDYDLYARALASGARLRVVNPLGYHAVERAGSISGRHGAADLGRIVAADRALLADFALGRREARAVRRHLAQVRREWAWLRLIDAVKARAPGAALGAFAGPPDVAASLLRRLAEQAALRARRRLSGGPGR